MRACAQLCFCLSVLVILGLGSLYAQDEAPEATEKETIKVEAADGKTILSVKRYDSGYEIYGADGSQIAKAKVKADRVKLSDKSGKVVCTIKRKTDGCKLYDSTGKEVAKIKRKSSGFSVKTPADITLARIKPKDYGFRATDNAGAILYRVKQKIGKVVVQDKNDQTLLVLKGDVTTQEASAFGLESFELLQRVGLLAYFQTIEKEREK